MPTQCYFWSINSARFSLKFWTTCFSGDCNMSQVEKEVVNSTSEVLCLGSGLHASLVLSPHQSGLEYTIIITTSHSPCHHKRREESLLFTTDCQQLDPCNLEKYRNVTGRSFPVAHLQIFFSLHCPLPPSPKSSFFSDWKIVTNETF